MIAIDMSDQEELGLRAQTATRDATPYANEVSTSIYDNVTLGQARIMMGNVGVESWQTVAGRKTTIATNRFKKDVKMMTGNIGGQAAVDFNQSFWALLLKKGQYVRSTTSINGSYPGFRLAAGAARAGWLPFADNPDPSLSPLAGAISGFYHM